MMAVEGYSLQVRGRRPLSLGPDEAVARRRFRWYLSECAIQQAHRYRLVSPGGVPVARGDEVDAVPFWVRCPGAGLG